MIEYKLFKENHSPVTLEDINEINDTVGSVFPEKEKERAGSKIRETYGVNGNIFHIYFGYSSTDICLPIKYEKKIKKTLKELAQLKFERIQCQ
jgi:hypothetical protein